MSTLDHALYTLGELDRLAAQSSSIHSLDPRAKAWVTLAFVVSVMSFGPYDISGLLPLFAFPVTLAALGNVPASSVGRKLLAAFPFVFFMAVCNPFLDTDIMLRVGPVSFSGGWLSFTSILLRFILTVSAGILLIATTGFTQLCAALTRMGVPRVFAVQLLFLYRYIFVLIHEGARMQRARELRSFGRRGLGLRSYGTLLGQLLLRTLDRARRIHRAMICRGFDGTLPLRAPLRYTRQDVLFMLGWTGFFLLARCIDLPRALGQLFTLLTRLPI